MKRRIPKTTQQELKQATRDLKEQIRRENKVLLAYARKTIRIGKLLHLGGKGV